MKALRAVSIVVMFFLAWLLIITGNQGCSATTDTKPEKFCGAFSDLTGEWIRMVPMKDDTRPEHLLMIEQVEGCIFTWTDSIIDPQKQMIYHYGQGVWKITSHDWRYVDNRLTLAIEVDRYDINSEHIGEDSLTVQGHTLSIWGWKFDRTEQ